MNKYVVGAVFSSNKYGDFKIIEKYNNKRFRIKFLLTDYEKDICLSCITYGEVRDPYYPIYYGVACLGEINIKENQKAFNVWRFMIERCYNKKHSNYYLYGEKGITVCKEWLCCENFLNDLCKIKGYNKELFLKGELQLDKDIEDYIQDVNHKEYSLKNCRFVNHKINHQEMLARRKQKTSSRYVGITKLKCGKWQASISYHSKNIYIGRFETEEDAHRAYENKKKELFNE